MEIFVILSACLIGQALGYFSAEKIQDQVSISYNGIELMRDSAEFPILTMGTGSFEATDSQGNFEITDEISTMVNFTAADPVEGRHTADDNTRVFKKDPSFNYSFFSLLQR